MVSMLFSIGGLVSILLLTTLAKVIGIHRWIVLLLSILILSVFAITHYDSLPSFVPPIMTGLYLGVPIGLLYLADLLVEATSDEKSTGSIRGTFLALQGIAWIIAPTIAGFVVANFGADVLYIYSIIPLLIIFVFVISWKSVPTASQRVLTTPLARTNIYHRFFSYTHMLFLSIFYAIMIIVTPVYLSTVAGWSWSTIGLAFTAMLVMFPIIQFPLGKWLENNSHSFQLIATIGFVILGITSIGIFLVSPISTLAGIALLVASRIAAASIEICNDTQFFLTTDSHDRVAIASYRSLTRLAYVIGSLAMLILTVSTQTIFTTLATAMGVIAIISCIGYLYERSIFSSTITPSSK
jgi:MFS family permease